MREKEGITLFNDNLRQLRKSHRLTQEQLAEIIGVERSSVGKYEGRSGVIPSPDILLRIADYFGVSIDYLMGRNTDEPVLVPANTKSTPLHRIPVLGRISAGLPIFAEEHILEYTYTDLNNGASYFALLVKGDSMNQAGILDGDIVVVRQQDEVANGSIAVVLIDQDDATIKQFFQQGDRVMLVPMSFNPIHQMQTYSLQDTDIRIQGLVVESKRKIK